MGTVLIAHRVQSFNRNTHRFKSSSPLSNQALHNSAPLPVLSGQPGLSLEHRWSLAGVTQPGVLTDAVGRSLVH